MARPPGLRPLNSGPCCFLPAKTRCTKSASDTPEAAPPARVWREYPLAYGIDYVEKDIGSRSLSNNPSGFFRPGTFGCLRSSRVSSKREITRWMGREVRGPQDTRFSEDCPTLCFSCPMPTKIPSTKCLPAITHSNNNSNRHTTDRLA